MHQKFEIAKRFASRNRYKILSGILLFIFVTFLSYLYFSFAKIFVSVPRVTPAGSSATVQPTSTPDPESPLNVLLLGYGGGNHEGPNLTDTMIVAHIDSKTKTIGLISIPRDTWVPIPISVSTTEFQKINAAYSDALDDKKYPDKNDVYKGIAGAGKMSADMAKYVTGLNIDNFIAVDFSSFVKGVNLIGGIDVMVPHTFDDYFYPIEGKEDETCGMTAEQITTLSKKYMGFELEKQFTCRYEHLHFNAGLTHMDGETTLKFVRSRHAADSNGSDFARSERQAAVIDAIRKKVVTLGMITKIVPIVNSLADSVRTDLDPSYIISNASRFGDPGEYKIYSIRLTEDNVFNHTTSKDGQFILVPKAGFDDWSKIHEFVQSEIDKNAK